MSQAYPLFSFKTYIPLSDNFIINYFDLCLTYAIFGMS